MEGDNFADPRKRSSRGRGRGRGRAVTSRGRGPANRGRGASNHGRGASNHGRGASNHGRGASNHGRGSGFSGRGAKRQQPSRKKLEELGSNAFRFLSAKEEEEQEDEFDTGADFNEAAAGSMADDPYADDYSLREISHERIEADLTGLEQTLKSVPLWVRLGDVARFGLGVEDDDVIENYLEPFEDDVVVDVKSSDQIEKRIGCEFSDALAGLSFDDEVNSTERDSEEVTDVQKTTLEEAKNVTRSVAVPKPACEKSDELCDEFDEWLDDM